MQQPALYDQIITKLRTKSDLTDVVVCLEEYIATFFSRKSLEEQQLIFRKLPKEIADLFITTLASRPLTPENQISIKRQIDELVDALHRCKTIELTIAFQANEETITLFSDWVKKNIRKDLLIDFHFDKAIVGGALIIADGAYKDYSVRKNLSNRFQIQREDIMGLLD
jgi:hypothetical protein